MQKQLEQCEWGWMMDNDLKCNKSMLKKEESVEVGVSGKYIHQHTLVRMRLPGYGIHSRQVRDKISIYHLTQPKSGVTLGTLS